MWGTHGFCNFFNRSKGAVYLRSLTISNRSSFYDSPEQSREYFNTFIESFVAGNQHLKSLNLSKTLIEDKQILWLLNCAPGLEEINLHGCIGVPRGGWRRNVTKVEFPLLREALRKHPLDSSEGRQACENITNHPLQRKNAKRKRPTASVQNDDNKYLENTRPKSRTKQKSKSMKEIEHKEEQVRQLTVNISC